MIEEENNKEGEKGNSRINKRNKYM